MRDASEIRQKIKQAQFRHVKRILRQRFTPNGEWPKDEVTEIKEEYREFFLSNPIHEIAKEFPDVAALMWVLGEHPDEPLAPNGTMVGSMGGVLLWADTDEDADYARELIERVMEEALRDPSSMADPVKKSWWQRIFG